MMKRLSLSIAIPFLFVMLTRSLGGSTIQGATPTWSPC